MGTLQYGNPASSIQFDDRALIHLQVVISSKLRRGENFMFSWTNATEVGSGRTAIWLDPSSTLTFKYHGNRTPLVNRQWIDELTTSANSVWGLVFSAEPGQHS